MGSASARAWLAFASVCFFWGTTYLAIRMALESFPVLALVALRFLVSGGLMLAFGALRGSSLPPGGDLWRTAGQGVLMLGVANACLSLAETWIPSGLAALFVTLSPFWLVGMDAATGGDKLHAPTLAGLGVGFLGVLFLLGPEALTGAGGAHNLKGFLVLQVGSLFWNGGSLIQRRQTRAVPVFVSGAVHQFASGLAFLIPALLAGSFSAIHWTWRGTAALAWLVVFGSIVGYTSYIYALERLPVAVVSLYNYVNPVVAVALGWWFYREPFGRREAAGMAIIFLGVALVRKFRRA